MYRCEGVLMSPSAQHDGLRSASLVQRDSIIRRVRGNTQDAYWHMYALLQAATECIIPLEVC